MIYKVFSGWSYYNATGTIGDQRYAQPQKPKWVPIVKHEDRLALALSLSELTPLSSQAGASAR